MLFNKISEPQRSTLNQIDKFNRHEFYQFLSFKFIGNSIIYRIYNNNHIKSYLINSNGRLTYYKVLPFPNTSKFTKIDNFRIKHKLKFISYDCKK